MLWASTWSVPPILKTSHGVGSNSKNDGSGDGGVKVGDVNTPGVSPYVLIVDDEKPIRRLLRRHLEKWGYTVKDASSASDALQLIFAKPPAIAITDIRMPGQDGLWLAERIREQWSEVAIIIASGADDIDLVEKSRHLGAVDYVRKPFDRELLRQALHRAAARIEHASSA